MKIQSKQVKEITLLFLLIVLFSYLQLVILTLFRENGDSDIRRFDHIVDRFSDTVISIVITIFIWVSFQKTPKLYIRTFYTFLVSFLTYWFFYFCYDWLLFDQGFEYVAYRRFINAFATTIVVHIQISCFVIAFLHLRTAQKNKTDLLITKKEKESLHLKVLQKNLEPHFLFNNLNVLSGLAKKTPEKIDAFIDNFSEVYRYYSKYEKEQTVIISEEIYFITKYMELINKRFGNAYQLKNNIKKIAGYIVPCTLQLCIENAIKHNKGSEAHPLIIELSNNSKNLFVKNKLNKVDFTVSTKLGNSYLEKQYQLNFEKEILFRETATDYIVEIPIIL